MSELHRSLMRFRGHLIVGYCSSLHLVWALTLWIDPTPDGPRSVTAVSQLAEIGPTLPWLLVFVAGLALVPLLRQMRGLSTVACMLPQQIVLLVAALSAWQAMRLATFADGVPRHHSFLIADQSPAMLAAAFHVGALLWCYLQAQSREPRS
jgi:hypothetical protein